MSLYREAFRFPAIGSCVPVTYAAICSSVFPYSLWTPPPFFTCPSQIDRAFAGDGAMLYMCLIRGRYTAAMAATLPLRAAIFQNHICRQEWLLTLQKLKRDTLLLNLFLTFFGHA